MKRTLLSWSSGKDSAWALHLLKQDPAVDLVGLYTVYNEKYDRASMHATRLDLLDLQAKAADMPLELIALPDPCSNEQCDAVMKAFVESARSHDITHMAFGDLFLEDVRQYRINQLEGTGIEPLFPLWQMPTNALAERILDAGVEAYISSVDLSKLDADYAGKSWDKALVRDLPPGTDPCGEHGEMHTIVVDGPMFDHRIPITIGETVTRGGFAFADIVPAP